MYKLLLLDDEDVIRRGLKVIIQREGVKFSEIYEASDGREGAELIKKYQPDIVITDIRMPHLDGLELIDQVYKSNQKKPTFIIISGYDDFDYARRAIKFGVKEYLLKPIIKEELIQLLNNIIQELDENIQKHEAELVKNMQSKVGVELLKEKYFNLLITGNFDDEGVILQHLAQLGVCFSPNVFTTLVVEYRPHNEELMQAFDEMDRFALKDTVDKGITGITKNFWSFFDANLRIVILVCDLDSFLIEAQLRKICDQITRALNTYLKVDTFFGVGTGVTEVVKIRDSYAEALELTLYKIVREPGSILFKKDVVQNYGSDIISQINLVRITSEIELNMKINIGNFLLEEYFLKLDIYQGPISRLEVFYNEFNKYMYDYFTEKGIDFSAVFELGEADFRDLDSFWTIDQLKKYLKGYLYKICDLITAYKSNSPDRKIIEQVVRYIRENFDKDINLNIVAAHFSKNNSYLSVLFKKETGQNFVDFLMMVRIEKAKEFLAQNMLKIQDIANKVGYPNAKHFCMVFKKIVGISPTQYREGSISK